jgi:hypothetical protein
MTAATATVYVHPKGRAHPLAVYSDDQIARVKALLAAAPRVEQYAPGTFDRIARETGVSPRVVKHVRDGTRRAHVAPAVDAEV